MTAEFLKDGGRCHMVQRITLAVLFNLLIVSPAFAKKVTQHPKIGIKDTFIVLLTRDMPREDVRPIAEMLAKEHGLKLVTTWDYLRAFGVRAKLAQVEALAADPRVFSVEQDHYVGAPVSSMQHTFVPPGYPEPGYYLWFLDRLDELQWPPNDGTYDRCPEAYNSTAYMIDMPVLRNHDALGSRVTIAMDCVNDVSCIERDVAAECAQTQFGPLPDFEHGTAVASLLTGWFNGAAHSEVISLSVFPCVFQSSSRGWYMANAVNWAWQHIAQRRASGQNRPNVVNHSGFVPPWDGYAATYTQAVHDFVNGTGVPFFTSADNFASNSCLFAPNTRAWTTNQRAIGQNTVFVVGNTHMNGNTDNAYYEPGGPLPELRGSNLGACVSAFAPGVYVYAAAIENKTTSPGAGYPLTNLYRIWEPGSSWSSPLAAAVALRWMEKQPTIPAYWQVYDYLLGLNEYRAPVTSATTASYFACVQNAPPYNASYVPPNGCGAGTYLYEFPSASNTSGARMIYSNFTCP
jgi:hypothetical protein